MPVIAWPLRSASPSSRCFQLLLLLLLVAAWPLAHGTSHDDNRDHHHRHHPQPHPATTLLSSLRGDTRHLFWHGYHNYIHHAYPEDELRPISCRPQTRNIEDPADIGLNDVLGNYSVTLVDSLSTLAILASDEDGDEGGQALREFQKSVQRLVGLYGDAREGSCGTRACGFDLDSKVQVFETNIRGVGGLLSAHLFAVGDLPIRGYKPEWQESHTDNSTSRRILWPNGFTYDDQLLHLAHDLASRLLPAFTTPTGLPYPRVNLRTGIPFYRDSAEGFCRLDGTSSDPREITETCAAGAGSLVLEFTTLSRLTGDGRFEQLAKKAFWAVWERRSGIGLIGAGLDAESGQWTVPPLAGIGAGTDSFFEYALKSYILLSGLTHDDHTEDDASDRFLSTWHTAHAAIKRHIHRSPASSGDKHPYYGQADLLTGAPRYSWIDNLSAYYPGLLALAGELEESQSSHLLYSALWTRYSALPERWHAGGAMNSYIDPHFQHWAGRPEFVESTYYLYQATKDPWYLRVGEMVLRDVRRRCWTRCGWAVLADVRTGEQRDRMESFFLGETAKYLFLLFAGEGHPINGMDAPVVFSTEGHPLLVPRRTVKGSRTLKQRGPPTPPRSPSAPAPTCPTPLPLLSLTVSNVANRPDLFHAAALAQLHLVPINPTRSSPLLEPSENSPGISLADVTSPTNYTFYPWTLPQSLIPPKGTSAPIKAPIVSTLTFPNLNMALVGSSSSSPNAAAAAAAAVAAAEKGFVAIGALQKLLDGVLINSLSNMRLNMVQEPKALLLPDDEGVLMQSQQQQQQQHDGGAGEDLVEYRVRGVANWALGMDEKVLISAAALEGVSPADPHFTRVKDVEMVDLVVDIPIDQRAPAGVGGYDGQKAADEVPQREVTGENINATMEPLEHDELDAMFEAVLSSGAGSSLPPQHPPVSLADEGERQCYDDSRSASARQQPQTQELTRLLIPAILPTGPGAAPLPSSTETINSGDTSSSDLLTLPSGQLPFQSIFYLTDPLCQHRLPAHVTKSYNILILVRGECSFNDKLANIPSFSPSAEALQLVVLLSTPESRGEAEPRAGTDGPRGGLIRPLLDRPQRTPNGFERRHPLAMVMVDGSEANVDVLRRVAKVVGSFDGKGKLVEEEQQQQQHQASRGNVGRDGGTGVGVKRRYWFESMGVPIGNLIML